MTIQLATISVADIEPNAGQIPGLPVNPRTWGKSAVVSIAASLKETPELFNARPLIVYQYNGKYVILGGNLRFEGAKLNGDTTVPCAIIPPETPAEKLKEIVIKDNGSWGEWDYDLLTEFWGDEPLSDWGVSSWEHKPYDDDIDDTPNDPQPAPFKPQTLTITIPTELADKVEDIRASVLITLDEWPGCVIK